MEAALQREGGGSWLTHRTAGQAAEAGRRRRRRRRRSRKYTWPEKPTLLGTAVKRLDGPDKVTGRAKYTYDINRPGMIYGKIVRSPHPHARIVSIDLSAAQKAPGVKAALACERQAGRSR